jgi:hypothetical protein
MWRHILWYMYPKFRKKLPPPFSEQKIKQQGRRNLGAQTCEMAWAEAWTKPKEDRWSLQEAHILFSLPKLIFPVWFILLTWRKGIRFLWNMVSTYRTTEDVAFSASPEASFSETKLIFLIYRSSKMHLQLYMSFYNPEFKSCLHIPLRSIRGF